MAIQLPGYEEIFANEVYGRNVGFTPEREGNGKQDVLREVILLNRYTEASEDQVVEYLRQKTEEVESTAALILPSGVESEGKNILESALIALPPTARRHIRTGFDDCIRFVRQNTPAPYIEEGELPDKFIYVGYGLIPLETIKANEERGNVEKAGWYRAALSHEPLIRAGMGERWNMKLLLTQNDELPNRAELDILLKHGAHESRTLSINRTNYPIEQVRNVANAIYEGLFPPQEIANLRDASKERLERLTLQPVIALHKLAREEVIEEALRKKQQNPQKPSFGDRFS